MIRSGFLLSLSLLVFSMPAPSAQACYPDPNMCPNNCDDGNPCTLDWCYAGSPICGCEHDPITSPPSEVFNLQFSSDEATFSWSPLAGCTYDVVRGLVRDLPVGDKPSEICVSGGLASATQFDSARPSDGEAYWYLVRARNSCSSQPGSYGYERPPGGPIVERITNRCP
jgi:hypothetical protein